MRLATAGDNGASASSRGGGDSVGEANCRLTTAPLATTPSCRSVREFDQGLEPRHCLSLQ